MPKGQGERPADHESAAMPDDGGIAMRSRTGQIRTGESVLGRLDPLEYELIWQRRKRHEICRRFPTTEPATWFVYLDEPSSRLAAVIELGPAVVGTPQRIADLAEESTPGTGAAIYDSIADLMHCYALPIEVVREYRGYDHAELVELLGKFKPPTGFQRLKRNATMSVVCDRVTGTELIRELDLTVAAAPEPRPQPRTSGAPGWLFREPPR